MIRDVRFKRRGHANHRMPGDVHSSALSYRMVVPLQQWRVDDAGRSRGPSSNVLFHRSNPSGGSRMDLCQKDLTAGGVKCGVRIVVTFDMLDNWMARSVRVPPFAPPPAAEAFV